MGATGLLDFFTLEAGEYLERLDGLVTSAGTGAPALDDLLTETRALRGSATMARQMPIAEVAAAFERTGQALREGRLVWDLALRGVIISAINDLKILVRHVRQWSADDETRASACRAELTRVTPAVGRATVATPSLNSVFAFVALEIADIAAALATQDGGDPDALRRIAPRLRALRGMATLRDLPPLGDVIDTVDDQTALLERTGAPASPPVRRLFVAAAGVLHKAAPRLRAGGTPDGDSAEVRAFTAATDALQAPTASAERSVPIATLFFADNEPHVVRSAPQPPTTLRQRFRREVVAPAEHLRRVVAVARQAADGPAKAPAVRALDHALGDLEALAHSCGEHDVARALGRLRDGASTLDPQVLGQVERTAEILSGPDTAEPPPDRLRRISGAVMPAAPSAPPAHAATEPSQGAALHALLSRGLAGLTGLAGTPLSPPVIVEEELIPIDALLYRGRAALDRAAVVRDALRHSAGPPDPDALEELYALIDLARAD
jgi:chemotaxis protein histidine kinase CheA